MSHIVVTPRTFNSFLNALKTCAFLNMLLIFFHLQQSLLFITEHWEIGELSGHDKAPWALVFSVLDSSLFIAAVASLIMKRKLSHHQYLTDTQNRFFAVVIIFCAVSSCIYAYLVYDATLGDEPTAETFEKAMLLAMALYPSGPKKRLVDRIQIKYSCCGATGPIDWFSIDWYNRKSNWNQDDVPFSCCSSALQIPCIHFNMKRRAYYVKYNSTTPTIWTEGCASKFKEVYLLNFDWLIYLGVLVVVVSFFLTVFDKMVQTADDTFAQNGRFLLGLWSREPQWDCLIEAHNRLKQKQKTPCVKVWSPKPKTPWKNMREVIHTIDRYMKQGKGQKRGPPLLSLDADGECAKLRPRPTSATNSVQSTLFEGTSTASSGSSARKRKLAFFASSSCIKRTKKNV